MVSNRQSDESSEGRAVLAHKNITQNPKASAELGGQVNADETTEALSLVGGGELKHVVVGRERERLAVQNKIDVGHGGDEGTVHS